MIRRLKSGEYQADLWHGKKRIRKSFIKKDDAKLWAINEKKRLKKEDRSVPESRTIKEAIEYYKTTVQYKKLRESTKKRYEFLLKHFEKFCYLNGCTMIALFSDRNAYELVEYAERFKGKGKIHLIAIAKLVFKHELLRIDTPIRRSPFIEIQIEKPERQIVRYLSHQELKSFFDNCTEHNKQLFSLLYYTGMRTGEAINLRWDDIDTAIHIRSKPNWNTKTRSSVRPIPLSDRANEVLSYFRKRTGGVGYVISGNGRFHTNKYQHALRGTVKRLKKKGIQFDGLMSHTFRKTFATHLMEKGVAISTIQRLLGHSDQKTTEIYLGVIPEVATDAVRHLV